MRRFRIALLPLSMLYSLVVVVRNWCYDVGLFRAQSVSVPVISVGNMIAGGTGKTPFVEYLIRYFRQGGKKVAVVSRGYKRVTSGMYVVSDGKTITGNAMTGGDEPTQIAEKFPDVAVVVDEKRARAAQYAVSRLDTEVILLDDGFQHRALNRDLDIVMINGEEPLRTVPMLPSGVRREPMRSLRRANVLAVSRISDVDWFAKSVQKHTQALSVGVQFTPKRFLAFCSGEPTSVESHRGKNCVAFCGIGNPTTFRQTIESTEVEVRELLIFPDHHWYSNGDLERIQRRFEYAKAEFIVTTEKDAARLCSCEIPGFFPIQVLYALEIETVVVRGESLLHDLLKRATSTAVR